jgi:hypothetical protein
MNECTIVHMYEFVHCIHFKVKMYRKNKSLKFVNEHRGETDKI